MRAFHLTKRLGFAPALPFLAGALLGVGAAAPALGQADFTCCWNNGEPVATTSIVSHLGGSVAFGAKAADDFYLCDGHIHQLRTISGVLITTSHPDLRRAKLELYEDCDGCPGDLLYEFTEFETPEELADLGDGKFSVRYTFVMANQEQEENRCIALRGGTYWVSLIGLSDNQHTDASAFAAVAGPIKGSVAKAALGNEVPMTWPMVYDFGPWTSVEEGCCGGCVDLAFEVCYDSCKILIDTGGAKTPLSGAASMASGSTSRNTRAAGDFVVGGCDAVELCYAEGCIFTNCVDFHAFLEIYSHDCDLPFYTLGEPVAADRTAWTNKLVDLKLAVTTTIAGQSVVLKAYRAEFHDLSGIVLDPGKHYWVSMGAVDTLALTERAFFCFAERTCKPACNYSFNPGAVVGPQSSSTTWESVAGQDFSFALGARITDRLSSPALPPCRADQNVDGEVTVADIFAFIATWMVGCP